MGHSAGAEIISLAVLDPQLAAARRDLNIRGVVAMAGLGYAPPQPSDASALPEYLIRFYHTAFGPQVEAWHRYDVTRFTRAGPPAWLVISGQDDAVAPQKDSAIFVAALRRVGASVDYLEQPDRNHDTIAQGMVLLGDDPVRSRVERFVLSQ